MSTTNLKIGQGGYAYHYNNLEKLIPSNTPEEVIQLIQDQLHEGFLDALTTWGLDTHSGTICTVIEVPNLEFEAHGHFYNARFVQNLAEKTKDFYNHK